VNEKKPDLGGLTLLVMDSDPLFMERTERELREYGAEVLKAESSKGASGIIYSRPVHAMLAGVDLMGEAPESFINEYKTKNPDGLFFLLMEGDTEVIGPDPSGLLVEDYLQKPFDPGKFAAMLEAARAGRGAEGTALEAVDPVIQTSRPYFSFRSPVMREALRNLPRIAASDLTVLVSGETGTGKEIISHAIHVMSPRSGGPFVAVNCGAIPEGLIEGELFGHVKGAFTGAHRVRKGKFEAAHDGTLLLDEIGDMPLHLQMRLLRVLEEKQVFRVGAERPVPVNVRVIAATLRDLGEAVEKGLFRRDLYYRLNVFRIHLPRLSERAEDISLLAVNFMDRAFMEMGHPPPHPTLSTAAVELLEKQPWHGNVRELRNVMTRVAILLPPDARRVLPMHISPHLEQGGEEAGAPSYKEGVFIPPGTKLREAEDMLIADALRQARGNRTRAAKRLGMGIRTLRRKLNKPR
jgi:DNA-binding NtrC family response regulator